MRQNQGEILREPVGRRKPGVPSQEEMYQILKRRSLELQRGEDGEVQLNIEVVEIRQVIRERHNWKQEGF